MSLCLKIYGKYCHSILLSSKKSSYNWQKKLSSVAQFSALDTEHSSRIILPKNFRCDKTDPAEHAVSDVGLFYTLPKGDFETICPSIGNRKAFLRRHIEEMESFNEAALMIRRPALEVINYLKHADYSLPVQRYLLYGDIGTGKSIALQHVTHYCMKQGWLIVPTLQAWDWVNFKSRYKVTQREEILESQWNKERYDQPVRATAWLETFRTMNRQHLANIKTSKEYVWSKRDKTEVGEPLGTLVDQGISRPRLSTDIIGCIMREICTMPRENLPRVLVTVDCINALFAKTMLKLHMGGAVAKANELAFVHNLKKLLKNTWVNGAVVAATNGSYTTKPWMQSKIREGQYAYEVLGHEAFDLLDPHIPVEVPNYADSEVLSQLAYYQDRKWIAGRAMTDDGRLEIIQLSCNNPSELAKFCGGLY